MDSSGRHVLVLDTGAGSVKCGLAGDVTPLVVPNLVGKSVVSAKGRLGVTKLLIGQDAVTAATDLKLEYPFEGSSVRKWQYMNMVWTHCFLTTLGSSEDLSDCKLLGTESPWGLPNKQEVVQELFEKYHLAGLQFGNCGVLAMHAHGLKAGTVVEAGESNTFVCPIYESTALNHLARRLEVGGRQLTEYLIKLLAARGYSFNRNVDRERARSIKEKLCYVAHDLTEEAKLAQETSVLLDVFQLADGLQVKLGEERFVCAEALFQPHLVDVDGVSLAELVFDATQSADLNIRSDLRRRLLLSGGTSLLPGLGCRLDRELRQLIVDRIFRGNARRLEDLDVGIEDHHPLRKYSVFLGASKLAEQKKDRESFWTSAQKYDEDGYDRLAQRLVVHAV